MARSSSNGDSNNRNNSDTQVTKRPEIHPPAHPPRRQRRIEEHEYRASGSYQASFSLNIFSAFSGLFSSKRTKTSSKDADEDKDGRRSSDGEDSDDGSAVEEQHSRVRAVRRSELTTSSVARSETAQRHRVIVEDLVDEQDGDGAGRRAVGRGKEPLAIKE